MCGKLKTISVEVRSGNGTTRYTYQTTKWPSVPISDNQVSAQQSLDNFSSQHSLEKIFCGTKDLCAMQRDVNRNLWKLIFDEIEMENDL